MRGEYGVVVLYEFDSGPPERWLIYRGSEKACNQLTDRLEGAARVSAILLNGDVVRLDPKSVKSPPLRGYYGDPVDPDQVKMVADGGTSIVYLGEPDGRMCLQAIPIVCAVDGLDETVIDRVIRRET